MAVIKSITYKGQKKTDTLNSRVRIEQGNGRIVVHDGTNNRILIGALPDGSYGLIISKPGVDVTDVTG